MTHSYNTRFQKKIRMEAARLTDGRGPGDMQSVPNLSEFLAVERALAQGMFPHSNPKPVLRADAPIWTPEFGEPLQDGFDEPLVEGEVMVDWDSDGDERSDLGEDLPQTVKIPAMKSDDVADYLSDNYGWCVRHWELVE